jgi:predicted metal-binding protein
MKNIKKISLETDDKKIKDDLEKYRKLAIDMGATDAVIVRAEDIPIDERVVIKCEIPRCFGYGMGANCPPNTLTAQETRQCVAKYKYAVFFKKEIAPEIVVRDKTTIKKRVDAYQQVFEIVNQLESKAFYDGYYLALGFAAGSCRHTYCGLEKECLALKGDKCRYSLKSRPSMEAVGIDVYKLATKVGWDIYPIGCDAKPGDIPKGNLAGIVLVC